MNNDVKNAVKHIPRQLVVGWLSVRVAWTPFAQTVVLGGCRAQAKVNFSFPIRGSQCFAFRYESVLWQFNQLFFFLSLVSCDTAISYVV